MEQNSIKKVMISQPMNGKTPEEIIEVRDKAVKYLEALGYEVLMYMSYCDVVYFCKGWDKTRGCILEHEAAEAYGLEIMYEE